MMLGTRSSGLRPHSVYLLLNDAGLPFWVGSSARPEGRYREHRRTFCAVRDLRMVVLKEFPNPDKARAIEEKIVRELARAGVELANFAYAVDKSSAQSIARARAIRRRYCEKPPCD